MTDVNINKLSSFDLETTGVNPKTARIVTSSLIELPDHKDEPFFWVANPDMHIPDEAANVHGYHDEDVKDAPDHKVVAAETIAQIRKGWAEGRSLIVYNAAYDLTILQQYDSNFTIDGTVIDPLVLDRYLDKYRKGSRTLTSVSEYYGVPLGADAHGSTADSLAAARIAWKMFKKYPELTDLNSKALMALQSKAHVAWQKNFLDYKHSRGETVDDMEIGWIV